MGPRGVLLHPARNDDRRRRPAGCIARPRRGAARGGEGDRRQGGCRLPGGRAAGAADLVLPVAAGTPEELSPLTYCIPLELLAFHYASTRGLTMLGFDDESRKALNFRQIFGE